MAYFDGLNNDAVLEMAREDWRAARESRREIEERKLKDWRLYRAFREEIAQNGGKGAFGWSRATVPLAFWIVETILPRLGTTLPTITVRADTPAAVPYATAKQIRAQRQWQAAEVEEELLLAIKSMLVLSTGVLKARWRSDIGGPGAVYVPWFDFYLSGEAERWERAECMIHRTWHTKRGIQELMKRDARRGEDGKRDKKLRLYDHDALERVAAGSTNRHGDPESRWGDLREAAGAGETRFSHEQEPIALVEIYYPDGTLATIAGDDSPELVRIEREPLWRQPNGLPFRPFSVIQGTPDLFQPHAISQVEMLEDFQYEVSTIANMALDQVTRNLAAPRGYDEASVPDVEEMRAAFAQPGGTFRTIGDPRAAVTQFAPGQLSEDFERTESWVRNQAQLVSGVTDIAAGIVTPGGLQNETAHGAAIIRDEGNMRYRLLLKLVAMGANKLVRHFDWLDRQMSKSAVLAEITNGQNIPDGAMGVERVGDDGRFVKIGPEVNRAGLDYAITVEASSLTPNAQSEQVQKLRALANDLLGFPPPVQTAINWVGLLELMAQAHGEDPRKLILPPGAPPFGVAPPQMPAGLPAGPGGPTPEPAPNSAAPGDIAAPEPPPVPA